MDRARTARRSRACERVRRELVARRQRRTPHETFVDGRRCVGGPDTAPAAAFGQAGSQIIGEVTDNTGGILPGVTVEASSPALIEGSRVAITDGAGRFTIVDLRPGTYTVTFTLPGFSVVVVEDQELPAGFVATVDAVLSVGALEETVTVSGEAPVVDVATTRRVEVLDREVLDAIPTGNNLQSTAQLIPGIKLNRPEVGLTTAAQQTYMSVHGMSVRQTTVAVDGQLVMSSGYDGANQNYNNHLANQEMVYETSGISAETSAGGVRINMIGREGGNTYSGQQYFGFSQSGLQQDQLTQRLKDRGASSRESIDLIYDFNNALGGPIVRDRFWFFGSFRRFEIDKPTTNSFTRSDDGSVPRYFLHSRYGIDADGRDFNQKLPGVDDNSVTSGLLRLTAQINQNNKFSVYMDRIIKQRFHNHGSVQDVATAARHHGSPLYYVGSAKWTATLSSRLLLEAGYSTNVENWSNIDSEDDVPFAPGTSLTPGGMHTQPLPAGLATCQNTPCYPGVGGYPGLTMQGSMNQYGSTIDPWYAITHRREKTNSFEDRYHWGDSHAYVERFNYNTSMSYVTGSHNLKVGLMSSWGPFLEDLKKNGALRQEYRDGVPTTVRVTNHPTYFRMSFQDVGAYVQDTWTIDRLTLNLGLRWETFASNIEETPATLRRFTNWDSPFPRQEGVPSWTNIAPRLGMAYDLFGDASTALKFSWGRYNASNIFNYARDFHPGGWQHHERDWFDCALSPTTRNTCATFAELEAISPGLGGVAYGGRDPNVPYEKGVAGYTGHQQHGGTNGDDYVQDWEVGVTADPGFGGPIGRPRQDPDGVARPWASLFNAGIQREILPGLSASFNWYRRDSFDGILQRNAAIGLSDYIPFQIANPCGPQSLEGNSRGMAPSGFPCSTRGVSAEPMLTVYSLTDEARARTPDHLVINTYGDDGYSDQYNGFETSFNARLPNGTNIFGGWTMERNLLTRCDTRDDPNELMFCDPTGAWGPDSYGGYGVPWLNEFKVSGTLPLPGRPHLQRVVAVVQPARACRRWRRRPERGRSERRRRARRQSHAHGQRTLERAQDRCLLSGGRPPNADHHHPVDGPGVRLPRSPEPGGHLDPEGVRDGERHALRRAGRHLQHHQRRPDHRGDQLLRRLHGQRHPDGPGTLPAVGDQHPLVGESSDPGRA